MNTQTAYRRGVAYIALNDEPTWMEAADVQWMLSVQTLAEAFDLEAIAVARAVVRFRKAEAKR